MNDDILNIEFIPARQVIRPPVQIEPKIDEPVSKIVGKKVYCLDPRLIKLIVRWKANKPEDSMRPDNFLENPKYIEELKKVFA